MRLIVKGYDEQDRLVFEDMKKVFKPIEPQLDHYLSEAKAQFDNVKRFSFELWLDPLQETAAPHRPRVALTNQA